MLDGRFRSANATASRTVRSRSDAVCGSSRSRTALSSREIECKVGFPVGATCVEFIFQFQKYRTRMRAAVHHIEVCVSVAIGFDDCPMLWF